MADIRTTTHDANFESTMKPDVFDIITNISPKDTVVTSIIGKGKATSTEHKWPLDELEKAGPNAVVEGADVEAKGITPPEMENNFVQNAQKSFMISDDAEEVVKHGRKSEVKYQTGKKLPELAKDIEWAVCNNKEKIKGDKNTPRKSMGLAGFITTNVYDFDDVKAPANKLTKDLIDETMEGAWEEGGSLSHIICTGKQQTQISGLVTNNNKIENASEKTTHATVQFYRGDFGDVAIMKHRYLEKEASNGDYYANMYFLDQKLWKLARFGADPKPEELARSGTSRKYMINGKFCLESLQQKGNAAIKNLHQKKVL